ncbi:tyrosine-type recombinase/integrase [Lactococcus insecticola]|uniref:Putative integrase-phage associated n=1 Tax=Pseudolactococcus insecticola TaxID=2709158 RepID=A0A6A0B6C6_9LACT|nr:site-specific integrase [Lactococcus insecticola]GFH40792.1 putative integrase - phage associated [Lactococcus insecticola]
MFYKKTSNGKYRYYEKFYDESEGKWKQATVTLSAKSRQAQGEARRRLDKKIDEKLSGEYDSRRNRKKIDLITVGEVFEEYCAFRKQELKDSTYWTQTRTVRSILGSVMDKRIKSVTTRYFQVFFTSSQSSATYKRTQKVLLNLFFRYALNLGYIDDNPIEKVELPRQRKQLEVIERKKAKFFSREEMKQFMSFFDPNPIAIRKNLLIEFMYLTGVRIGEALALTWENVDLEKRIINIKYTVDYLSVKISDFKITSPKTIDSYRKISINTRCIEILNEMNRLNHEIVPKDKRFVFLNNKGTLIDPKTVNFYLKEVGKRACLNEKYPEGFSSHMLRHSHISLLAEIGVPIKAIMERVGHSDEKTTIGVYMHVTEKMRDEVSEKMENIG